MSDTKCPPEAPPTDVTYRVFVVVIRNRSFPESATIGAVYRTREEAAEEVRSLNGRNSDTRAYFVERHLG